jgi:hypothetical protein
MISGGGSASWQCGGCGKDSVYVAEGIIRSTIGIGLSDGTVFYPKVSRHPRFGIPSHGAPDKQPVEGGEFFRSRGIGLDSCLCFVCGTNDRTGEGVEGHTMLHNIAAFVACRESGERVVAMFQQGAKLDYREYEPDYVQVKIGACDKHLLALQFLHAECGDGRITAERIAGALKVAIPTVE